MEPRPGCCPPVSAFRGEARASRIPLRRKSTAETELSLSTLERCGTFGDSPERTLLQKVPSVPASQCYGLVISLRRAHLHLSSQALHSEFLRLHKAPITIRRTVRPGKAAEAIAIPRLNHIRDVHDRPRTKPILHNEPLRSETNLHLDVFESSTKHQQPGRTLARLHTKRSYRSQDSIRPEQVRRGSMLWARQQPLLCPPTIPK